MVFSIEQLRHVALGYIIPIAASLFLLYTAYKWVVQMYLHKVYTRMRYDYERVPQSV